MAARPVTRVRMMLTQSFTPRSSTLWLPSGMPASARRSTAALLSAVNSLGWLKWVFSHRGWCFFKMLTNSGVMREGSTTGTRLPMRMISTCGMARSSPRIHSRRWSDSSSGSPPDSSTSRICGVLRM